MELRLPLSCSSELPLPTEAHIRRVEHDVQQHDVQQSVCKPEAHVGTPCLILDPDGRVLRVFGDLGHVGLGATPALPASLSTLWGGALRERALAGLESVVRERRALDLEVAVAESERPNHQHRILRLAFAPVSGDDLRYALTVASLPCHTESSRALDPCQSLLDAMPDPVVMLDTVGRIRCSNAAFQTFAGQWADLPGSACAGLDYLALCETHGGLPLRSVLERALRTGDAETTEVMWRHGVESHSLSLHVSPLAVYGVTGLLVSQKELPKATEPDERLQLASSVFDNSLDAILTLSPHGRVQMCNPAAQRLLGGAEAALRGRSFRHFLAPSFPVNRQRRLLRVLSSRRVYRGELPVVDAVGQVTSLWVSISAVRDAAGRLTQWVVVASDIRRLKQTQDRLQQMAFYDALTGLPNRRLAQEHIRTAMRRARRHSTSMAVLFFDLDGFKAVNDSLGHEQGDRLLCQVAQRLGEELRSCDLLARLGGDEFVVVVEDSRGEGAVQAVAEKLVCTLRRPFSLGGRSIRCGASVGAACFPAAGDDPRTLLRCADLAMYRAKHAGGGQVVYYHPLLDDTLNQRFNSPRALRSALSRGDFRVLFHPIQEVASRRVVGVEALLRLHDRGRWLPPAAFLHLVEQGGWMPQLGEWVFAAACAQLRQLTSLGHSDVCLCVNLSLSELVWPPLMQMIESTLQAHRLDASRLVIEVAPHSLQRAPERGIHCLNQLAALGVRIAADGLQRCGSTTTDGSPYRFDIVKVELALLQRMSCLSRADVRSALAARLGSGDPKGQWAQSVVAKGVEYAEHVHLARRMSCDAMQGYGLSVPLEIGELEHFMAEAGSAGCPDKGPWPGLHRRG